MIKTALPFVLVLSMISSFAQKTDENYNPVQYKAATCKSSFDRVRLEGEATAENILKYLRGNFINLQDEKAGLILNYVHESPGGFHYSFTQTFHGVKVYQSEVKVNVDRKNVVRSVFDNSENTSGWNIDVAGAGENSVIAIDPKTLLPVLAERKIEDQFFETLVADGEVIFRHDLRSFFGVTDSLVHGRVFNPDPLTSAEVYYDTINSIYRNNGDSSSVWFETQYDTVTFRTRFDSSLALFTLESPYVHVIDFDTPFYPIATSTTPEFYFDRSQSGFEDVNAFYHISIMQNHIHSLGFGCADSLVEIDPHGYFDFDQSLFYPGNPNRIAYGDGGVDDAEDADVCVHEYGHSVSFTASPNSNYGLERNGLDEGFGDYLATSYSKSISNFNEFWMFNWDGHNEFWNGRVVNSPLNYPPPGGSSFYRYCSIWASALYAIHNEIGRETTDSLILEAHYNYAQYITLPDAAQLLIDADTTLFNGHYFCIIYKHLLVRNLVPYNSAFLSCLMDVANLDRDNIQLFQDGTSFTLLNANEEKLQLQILNINGQFISGAEVNQSAFHYQNENLPVGIYLVALQSKDAIKTFKWCKSR